MLIIYGFNLMMNLMKNLMMNLKTKVNCLSGRERMLSMIKIIFTW